MVCSIGQDPSFGHFVFLARFSLNLSLSGDLHNPGYCSQNAPRLDRIPKLGLQYLITPFKPV
jgi:hypothetical protein